MLRHVAPVVVNVHHSSDTESGELERARKAKSGSRQRHTSPSRFMRIVTRNTDGKRPHTVQRTLSYSELSVVETHARASLGEHQNGTSGADMAAATVPNSSSSAEPKQFLSVEEPRARKSSGGSQGLLSLNFRFGGKGKEKKRKKSELLSPNSQTPSLSFSEDNLTFYDIPPETLRLWKKSLDNVLADQAGRVLFQRHLCSEHSTENWEFCEEVDRFKTLPENKLAKEAKSIAATYIGDGTPKAVNIDAKVANSVKAEMKHPHRDMFDKARDAAYELMSEDTFRRFTMSQDFQKASTRDRQSPQPPMATS